MKPSTALKQNMRQAMEIFGHHPMFSNIRIIGSIERYEDTPDCDIDFYVDAADNTTLFDIGNLIEELESLLDFPVDIKTSASKLSKTSSALFTNNWEEVYE